MRLALGIEYDGSAYFGWQLQPKHLSVQQVLEEALAQIAGEPVRVHCAGRTDTGVHATSQVVHFETTAQRPISAWWRGVNAHLPPTLAVRWAAAVSDEFHARFSAKARRYRYLLYNHPTRPALGAMAMGWQHRPLDGQAMQEAAAKLVGEHDFSSFRAAACQAASPVRQLFVAQVRQCGPLFVFDFAANGFLHHMVRNMVGALAAVGRGEQAPAWISRLLAQRDRRLAAPTISPAGLYLCGIDYENHWGLPQEGKLFVPPLLGV